MTSVYWVGNKTKKRKQFRWHERKICAERVQISLPKQGSRDLRHMTLVPGGVRVWGGRRNAPQSTHTWPTYERWRFRPSGADVDGPLKLSAGRSAHCHWPKISLSRSHCIQTSAEITLPSDPLLRRRQIRPVLYIRRQIMRIKTVRERGRRTHQRSPTRSSCPGRSGTRPGASSPCSRPIPSCSQTLQPAPSPCWTRGTGGRPAGVSGTSAPPLPENWRSHMARQACQSQN